MNADQNLAAYQAALLECLGKCEPAVDTLARLKGDAAFTPYSEYIDTFELRMIEVASELVRKWGVREDAPHQQNK